ncbi:SIMPL domain-containing protein [Novosphingobium sp. TH158]|uniref:SIMPL domain-containing protein n=1 Tax=Novosphingobium sp. TH158 TaxID=2067455 RepID=UPI000C7D578A|nr:SIMPL domain-containing protein [Novosphingobium sp. TH158]PLK24288.1 hypothetical protein C0V78_13545 [Novosphingobium sp. TH158]
MKPLHLALAALALSVPLGTAAHAHDPAAPAIAPGNTLLTLTAQGRVARAPDIAVFTAGVMSQARTAAEALADNSAKMNRVIAALRTAGIAERDIQTSDLSLSPVYGQQRPLPDGRMEPEQPQVVGYRASNTVSVRQRNLKQFGRVLDTLVAAGANQIDGPRFEIDKADAVADEARTLAVRKARARADLYAAAAGMKVVRIVSISESGGYVPQPMMVNARMAAEDFAGAPTPVASGEVSMSVSVNVAFELAP